MSPPRIQVRPKKGITLIHSYSFRMGLEPEKSYSRNGFKYTNRPHGWYVSRCLCDISHRIHVCYIHLDLPYKSTNVSKYTIHGWYGFVPNQIQDRPALRGRGMDRGRGRGGTPAHGPIGRGHVTLTSAPNRRRSRSVSWSHREVVDPNALVWC